MRKTIVVLCICVWSTVVTTAQGDSLRYTGPQVVVEAASNSDIAKRSLGTSRDLHESLTDIASIQIQQLAPGGLATAINGASAARHVALLWEGWNIQSPINGTYDLSLVPMAVFNASKYVDRVRLQGSGTSSHKGVIDLGSADKSFVSYNYDTWNDHTVAFSKQIGLAKGELELQGAVQERDLSYRYDRFGEVVRQDEASQRSGNLQAKYSVDLSRHLSLSVGTWWQSVDRTLASSKTAANANESQTDKNLRTNLKVHYHRGKHQIQTKVAYFDEYIRYGSNTVDSEANNYANMLATTYTYAGKHPTTVEVLLREDVIRSTFNINRSRQSIQVYLGKDFVINRNVHLSTSVRQDLIDANWQPTTMSARVNYSGYIGAIELQHAYTYTPPTLNDLYWPQLGNANLNTERGSLSSLQLRSNKVAQGLAIGITGHYQVVNDWILWAPDDRGTWRPSNARNVVAQSVLLDVNYQLTINDRSSFAIDNSLSYGHTTTRSSNANERLQLIYTPLFRYTGTIKYTIGRLAAKLSTRYTGKRFTNTTNTNQLNPFTLVDASVNYTFNNDINIGLDAFNIMDERYEIVPFFPTSLRHFSFTISKPI